MGCKYSCHCSVCCKKTAQVVIKTVGRNVELRCLRCSHVKVFCKYILKNFEVISNHNYKEVENQW